MFLSPTFFDDVDEYLKIKPRLDPHKENVTKMIYGIPKTIPIDDDLNKPISPRDSFEIATKYISKLKEKGLIHVDISQIDENIKRYFESQKDIIDITPKIDDIEPPKHIINEDFQNFWHSTDTVKLIKSEILNLPFKEKIQKDIALEKFIDMISKKIGRAHV